MLCWPRIRTDESLALDRTRERMASAPIRNSNDPPRPHAAQVVWTPVNSCSTSRARAIVRFSNVGLGESILDLHDVLDTTRSFSAAVGPLARLPILRSAGEPLQAIRGSSYSIETIHHTPDRLAARNPLAGMRGSRSSFGACATSKVIYSFPPRFAACCDWDQRTEPSSASSRSTGRMTPRPSLRKRPRNDPRRVSRLGYVARCMRSGCSGRVGRSPRRWVPNYGRETSRVR